MDAVQPSSRGRPPGDIRARRPPHRPGTRTLPATHPAVRFAARRPGVGTAHRPQRPTRSDQVRRSLRRELDRGFRPDIEGLRALAVSAVVVYHARLLGVHGGFIGVDVFFVVSGFLITRLIVGELEGTGRLSLRTFWARRARRLLAASALVVATTALASHLVLPPLTQRSVVTDVVAAATFSSNFVFAGRLGSYFGAQLAQSTPSPLLHFWSLAVEEQFYLFWPPLLVLLTRRPRQYRRLVLATVVLVGGLGFVLAAWMTPRAPSWAFFLLPTRMGELLAGALLAIVGSQVRRIPDVGRAALAWIGLAVVVAACFRFEETMPWPGTAVLVPVLGTMAVIVGGSVTRLAWSPGRPLSTSVLQWIGRHSYALYLWHWPVLVLADARWGPLTWFQRLVAVAVALGLSALSLRYVENPVRHARTLAASPARSLAFGAAMVLAMLLSGWALARSIPPFDGGAAAATPDLVREAPPVTAQDRPYRRNPAAPPATTPSTPSTAPPTTLAPLAAPDAPTGELARLVTSMQRILTTASEPAPVPSNLRPSLGEARNRALPYTQGCVNIGVNARLQPCEFGAAGAMRTILLYGDSHAVQWFEPLEQIAQERGYRLVLLIKGGCPVADVVVPTPVLRYTCPPYRDSAIGWIADNQPAVVVVSNSYVQYTDDAETWAAGADDTLARLAEVSPHVVVIGDNPSSRTDPPACLSGHVDDATACATARADAVRPDRVSGELTAARAHGATFVDTTDWFCTAVSCPVVVGDLLVLRDETHITPPMAEFLTPLLDAALDPVFRSVGDGRPG
jgi:peptidoglycan/LPS O-acetylase OafA/YrhL